MAANGFGDDDDDNDDDHYFIFILAFRMTTNVIVFILRAL